MSHSCQPNDTARAPPGVHTPCSSTQNNDTIVFLRANEESKPDLFFVPNSHSITLKELVEEYNISSVIECDTNGAVQPRAVAFDSPSDVLRSGHHYIARRHAKVDNGGSRVTFKGKILVQEFDLPTPPQSHFASNAPSFTNDLTPMPKAVPVNPAAQQPLNQNAGAPGQADRKRWREGDTDDVAGEDQRGEQTGAQQRSGAPLADTTNMQPLAMRKSGGSGFTDNMGGVPSLTASTSIEAVDSSALRESGAGRQRHTTQFTPFLADLNGKGEDVLVTLESLKELCKGWEKEKDENQRKHADAMEVLESTRRVLFSNS